MSSLDSTLRGLAAEIGQSRTPTGSVAAPAKLRHRTGAIDAYTAGGLTASVQIGGDIVDAPFLATYSPAVGDTVSVLINNGSPLILGPVNKAPNAGAVVTGDSSGADSVSITSTRTGPGSSVVSATSDAAITIGYLSYVQPGAPDSAVYGREAHSNDVGGTALGAYSGVTGAHGLAAGYSTVAGTGSVALGTDAAGVGAVASGSNEIVLGTTSHTLEIPGKFLLRDSLGQTWQLVVDTSGTLSTVAYP